MAEANPAPTKSKRRKYDPAQMTMAIEAVRNRGCLKKTAARVFQVPRTTLLDKLAGRVPEESVPPGTRQVLTRQEKKTMVNYILLMADIGYPLTRKELFLEVKRILDIDGRTTPFKDNQPGKDWYSRFSQRNPEKANRTPQSLGHERALISKCMIDGWFRKLLEYLKTDVPGYEELIKDPRRIFNADESGFPLCVKSGKVLAASGAKHVYHVVANNKTQITVMACFNALGDYLPPLIVYPGQRLRDVGMSDFPTAIYGNTESGWMDSELFVSFLGHFVDFVKEKGIQFPVILFVDGHSTHMTLAASEFCAENNVILYCLLPHATHVLQACDMGLFSPLKSAWIASVKSWQMEHIGEVLTKKTFPKVFKSAWDKVATLENSCQGFKKSGLFPLTPDGIDITKLGPSKMYPERNVCSPPSASSSVEMAPVESSISDTENGEDKENEKEKRNRENVETNGKNHENEGTNGENKEHEETGHLITVTADVHQPVDAEIVQEKGYMATSIVPAASSRILVNRRDNQYVSTAFDCLIVPEPKKKKTNTTTIRQKLPKALSGTEALEMLRQREREKIEEEEKKKKRKEEREKKKIYRENDQAKRKIERQKEQQRKKLEREKERERKKQVKEMKNKGKGRKRKNTRKSNADGHSESDTDENDDEAITYMDSSDGDDGIESPDDEYDMESCAECNTYISKGPNNPWIGCDRCSLWYHQKCTKDRNLIKLSGNEISKYTFVCMTCKLNFLGKD